MQEGFWGRWRTTNWAVSGPRPFIEIKKKTHMYCGGDDIKCFIQLVFETISAPENRLMTGILYFKKK